MDDSVPATFEDGKTEKVVPGEGTYTVAPDGTVTFVPEKDFIGTANGVTVVRQDKNGTKASAKYTPTVTPVKPVGEPKETTDVQGVTQTGKVEFKGGSDAVPMDNKVPATFEDGSTTKTVPGEGTYSVAKDGTVTFTPEKDFVGTAKGVTVVRQDINGTKAKAKYTPTVIANRTTEWVKEGTNEPLKDPVVAKAFKDGQDEIDVIEVVDGKKQIVTYYKVDTKETASVKTYVYAKEKTTKFMTDDAPAEFIKDGKTYIKSEKASDEDETAGVKKIFYKEVKTIFQFKDGSQAPIDDINGKYADVKPGTKLTGTDGATYEVYEENDPVSGVKIIKVKKVVKTEWVTEDGETLEQPVVDENGQPKKDIAGYKFVRTEIDPTTGDVKHIYKKVAKKVTTKWVTEDVFMLRL